jgi:cytochrome c-type biogenesis protein CcmH/NrfF
VWVDDVPDTGISIVLWLIGAAIVVGTIVSWVWTRNHRRRVARYEAWLDDQDRRRAE